MSGPGLGLGGVFSLKSMFFVVFFAVLFVVFLFAFCFIVLPIGSWLLTQAPIAPLKE